MTSADPRPRTVEVAFWSWVASAILLVLGGMRGVSTGFGTLRGSVSASVTDDQVHSLLNLVRWTGGIYIALGIAVGFLAGRTRKGDKRFRRASVALSFAIVALVVLCAVLLGFMPPLAPLAVITLLVAAIAATRDSASAWFDTVDSGSDRA